MPSRREFLSRAILTGTAGILPPLAAAGEEPPRRRGSDPRRGPERTPLVAQLLRHIYRVEAQ
jgi:hypothetical protein